MTELVLKRIMYPGLRAVHDVSDLPEHKLTGVCPAC